MDLPNYTNSKAMRDRLLIAISLCGEIDDDGEYMDYDEEVSSRHNDMTEGVTERNQAFMEPNNWDYQDAQSDQEEGDPMEGAFEGEENSGA